MGEAPSMFIALSLFPSWNDVQFRLVVSFEKILKYPHNQNIDHILGWQDKPSLLVNPPYFCWAKPLLLVREGQITLLFAWLNHVTFPFSLKKPIILAIQNPSARPSARWPPPHAPSASYWPARRAAAKDVGSSAWCRWRPRRGGADEYSKWWKSPNWLGIQCGKICVIQPDSYGFPIILYFSIFFIIFLCFSYGFPRGFLVKPPFSPGFPCPVEPLGRLQLGRLAGSAGASRADGRGVEADPGGSAAKKNIGKPMGKLDLVGYRVYDGYIPTIVVNSG